MVVPVLAQEMLSESAVFFKPPRNFFAAGSPYVRKQTIFSRVAIVAMVWFWLSYNYAILAR